MSYFDELAKANAEETLKQEELFPLFSRAHHLLRECLRALAQENTILQYTVVDLGAEIAANIDRNKAIFTRSLEYNENEELVDIASDKKQQQADMLCRCMDIQQAIVKKDKPKQIQLVEKTPISRLIFETVITEWLNSVKGYTQLTDKNVKAASKEDLETYLQSSMELYKLEQKLDLDTTSGYNTIKYIQRRMEAIRSIYNRIAKAYARAVLKMARGQSVSPDYVLDSYQNGNLGLLRAIGSYDHISNARFPGYAAWWIRQRMLFCMKEEANIIKVSSNTWQHYAKLESVRIKLEGVKGIVTHEDIAEAAGYAKSHVESIYNSIKTSQVKSLEYHLSSEGFTLLAVASGSDDPIIVEDAATAAEEILALEEQTTIEEQDYNNVEKLLNKLPVEYRRLICLQYGLVDRIKQNLDIDKVTLERIRQELAAKNQKAVKAEGTAAGTFES